MNKIWVFVDYYNKIVSDKKLKNFSMHRVLNGEHNIRFGLMFGAINCSGGIAIGDDNIKQLITCKQVDDKLICDCEDNIQVTIGNKKMSVYKGDKFVCVDVPIPPYKSFGVDCDKSSVFSQVDEFLKLQFVKY